MTEATWPSRFRDLASGPLPNADSNRHSDQGSVGSVGSVGSEGCCSRGSVWFSGSRGDDNSVAQRFASHIYVRMCCAIVNQRDCCAIRPLSTVLSSRRGVGERRFWRLRPSAVYHLRAVLPAHSKLSNHRERVTRSWPVSLLSIFRTTCIFDACSAPGSAQHFSQSAGHVSRCRARSVSQRAFQRAVSTDSRAHAFACAL